MLKRVLLATMVLGTASVAAQPAHQPQAIRTVEVAERVFDESKEMPGESAPWQRIALPDEWRRTAPDSKGRAWYRIRFSLDQAPKSPQSILLKHLRASNIEFYANGTRLGDSVDWQSRRAGAIGLPVRVTVPASLLREGTNELLFRLVGSAKPTVMHGLGRVTLGDAAQVRELEITMNEVSSASYRYSMAAMFAVGFIALLLWFARRKDKVMFWFAVGCLLWATANAFRFIFREAIDPLFIFMNFNIVRYGLVPPTVMICLRTAGLRKPGFELAVWGLLAVAVAAPAFGWTDINPWMFLGAPAIAASLLLTGAGAILMHAPRPLRWSHRLEIAAVAAMALLLCHEFARYFGWIDIEAQVLRHFHVPVMVVAMGAAIFERHVAAIWRIERSNTELEHRVAEKTREIEANSASLEESRRQQALAAERQRIMADMHDGVGASLIGLLRHAQSGNASPASIEQRVNEALQEMRIAVDALQSREDDMAAVLGSLRYRLNDMIQATGVELEWDVAELPAVRGLTPTVVFAVQRILLEAISNALKHAGARKLRIAAHSAEPDQIEIRIEDDGRGFETANPRTGLGIGNMLARAGRIGAQLDIVSRADAGTSIRLTIPCDLDHAARLAPATASSPGVEGMNATATA